MAEPARRVWCNVTRAVHCRPLPSAVSFFRPAILPSRCRMTEPEEDDSKLRSGIQSISRGQIEAARAIGLGSLDTYRRIIFPQALRVMIPPAAGQYVSVVKNSSLGVAIGYPELFSVNNTIVTLSGHTVEAIAIMMSIYLAISFVIAALMNLYNHFVQIKDR